MYITNDFYSSQTHYYWSLNTNKNDTWTKIETEKKEKCNHPEWAQKLVKKLYIFVTIMEIIMIYCLKNRMEITF